MKDADYRKINDRSQNSSTYHKKDGTNVRAKLKEIYRREEEFMDDLEESVGHKIYGKIVLLPITVSYGDYCFGHGRVCEHFDNEGGWSRCTLGLGELKDDKDGDIPKPKKCMELKEGR